MFDVNAAGRGHLYPGATYFTLVRGVEAYSKYRYGQSVTGKAGEATVNGTIETMQIGPLGSFFGAGTQYGPLLGRAFDVRSLADAVEAAFKKDAKDVSVVDPREIYTAVTVRVLDVVDPAIPDPIAA